MPDARAARVLSGGAFLASSAAPLPATTTSYDVLKSAAVAFMVIDHIGYCFFPEQEWLRALGRACVPIWLFLIGYARSRRIDLRLVGGMAVLLLVDAGMGRSLLPLNILGTIILLRLVIDPLMKFIGANDVKLIFVTAALYLVDPFFSFLWSYGSLAVILAMCGYMARNGFQGAQTIPRLYGLLACGLFVFSQQQMFYFTPANAVLMAGGVTGAFAALFAYLPLEQFRTGWPAIRTGFPGAVLRFMGRHTLEIYVGHFLAFKMIAFFLCRCADCSCHPFGFNPLSLLS